MSAAAAAAAAAPEPLSAFLRRTRAAALDCLHSADAHRTAPHLTLIMGNEAGDLDSLASSIAFAYLLTHLPAPIAQAAAASRRDTVFAPLIQTAAADLYLRPENEAICQFAGIGTAQAGTTAQTDTSAAACDLLTIDALEGGEGSVPDALGMDLASDARLAARTGQVSFGLVDHPALIPRWGDHAERDVRYIVDHHKDEGAHPQAALRFLRGPGSVPEGQAPVGSASSMVVEVFQDELLKAAAQPAGAVIPKAVADLLISAIVIDTDNLRPVPRGRATPRDVLSHAILLPLSSFGASIDGPTGLDGQDSSRSSQVSNGAQPGVNGSGAATSGAAGTPAASAFLPSGTGPSASPATEAAAHLAASEHSSIDGDMEPMMCDAEEPAIFDVEMDPVAGEQPPTPCCGQAARASQAPRSTPFQHRTDFKARCDSSASTAKCCHGNTGAAGGHGTTRPSVSADPCGGTGRDAVEEEADEEDDVMEEMAGRDLYRILGLKRGVDQTAIRTAYRREALKCHPDRARSLQDAERRTRRFKMLVNAYEILSDPIKRRQYDLFYDPLTAGADGSGASTPGARSYASSNFSYSYSSSYNTSSSFFDNYGSSFSSSSYFSTSPPPQNGGAGFAGFRGRDGSKWKFETYDELKAEELARTETRTVSESLFAKQRPKANTDSVSFTSAAARMTSSVSTLTAERPPASDSPMAVVPPTPTLAEPVSTTKPIVAVPTPAAAAAAPRIAPTPTKFSFVWESPAESLRRARARPGGPTSSGASQAPAAKVAGSDAGPAPLRAASLETPSA